MDEQTLVALAERQVALQARVEGLLGVVAQAPEELGLKDVAQKFLENGQKLDQQFSAQQEALMNEAAAPTEESEKKKSPMRMIVSTAAASATAIVGFLLGKKFSKSAGKPDGKTSAKIGGALTGAVVASGISLYLAGRARAKENAPAQTGTGAPDEQAQKVVALATEQLSAIESLANQFEQVVNEALQNSPQPQHPDPQASQDIAAAADAVAAHREKLTPTHVAGAPQHPDAQSAGHPPKSDHPADAATVAAASQGAHHLVSQEQVAV